MQHFSRRRLLGVGATLCAGGWLGAPALQAAEPPLRVWRYKGLAASFLDLAGQDQTPYPVQWVDTAGGNIVLEALRSGDLDYAYMSEIPPVFAQAAGSPLALIASFEGDANDTAVVVKRQSAIHQVADLKGKSISYVRATNNHFFLLDLLQKNSLTLQDITPVPMPMQDALTAFRSGHIDAVVVGGISALQAESGMEGRLLPDTRRYGSSNYLIATTAQTLDDAGRRARIGDFLLRERATWDWVQQHPQAWPARSQALTGIDQALYLQQAERRSRPGRLVAFNDTAVNTQQQVADTLFNSGLLPRSVDVRPLWRNDFSSLLNG